MALSTKPGCTISVSVAQLAGNGLATPLPGAIIAAVPNTPYLEIQQVDSSWVTYDNLRIPVATDQAGTSLVVLPIQTDCNPATVLWALYLSNGVIVSGPIVPGMVNLTVSPHDLVATWGWVVWSTAQAGAVTSLGSSAPIVGPASFVMAGLVKQTVFNVSDYGAVPGATSGFAAAFNQTVALAAAAGGIVEIPPGLFWVDALLNGASNVTVRGDGMGVTTLRLVANAARDVWHPGTVTDMTISDMTIDANGINGTNGMGIYAPSPTRLVVTRVHFLNSATQAIYLATAPVDCRIFRCAFDNNGVLTSTNGTTGNVRIDGGGGSVENCILRWANGTAMSLYGSCVARGNHLIAVQHATAPNTPTATVQGSGGVGSDFVAGKGYSYSVTAVVGGVEGKASGLVVAYQGTTPFPIVIGITPTVGATAINVYRSDVSHGLKFIAQVTGTLTSYTDAGSTGWSVTVPATASASWTSRCAAYHGILLRGSGASVVDNDIDMTHGTCLGFLAGTHMQSTDVTFAGNRCIGSINTKGFSGGLVDYAGGGAFTVQIAIARTKVNNNSVVGCCSDGILLGPSSTAVYYSVNSDGSGGSVSSNCEVIGNIVTDTTGLEDGGDYGVGIETRTSNSVIANNVVERSCATGFYIGGGYNVIAGNTSQNNGLVNKTGDNHGIVAATYHSSIVGNISMNNGNGLFETTGIQFNSDSPSFSSSFSQAPLNNLVQGNRCGDTRAGGARTQGWGILLDAPTGYPVCDYMTISGNDVTNNIYGGVGFFGTGQGTPQGVLHNTIFGNNGDANYAGIGTLATSGGASNVAVTDATNDFLATQGIRSGTPGTVAAALHAPWVTGDTLPTMRVGASNAGNNQTALIANSDSTNAVFAQSNSGVGVNAASTSSIAVQGISTSGAGVVGTSTSGTGVSATSGSGHALAAFASDAGTTNQPSTIFIGHRSSATPAAGFGHQVIVAANSDTVNDRNQLDILTSWVTATDASRVAQFIVRAYDTSAREVLRGQAIGGAPALGLLGAAAIVRQTLPAAATDAATTQALTNAIRTLLINFGLGQ